MSLASPWELLQDQKGVAERGGEVRLRLEARQAFAVRGQVCREDLEGHEALVLRLPNLTHAALRIGTGARPAGSFVRLSIRVTEATTAPPHAGVTRSVAAKTSRDVKRAATELSCFTSPGASATETLPRSPSSASSVSVTTVGPALFTRTRFERAAADSARPTNAAGASARISYPIGTHARSCEAGPAGASLRVTAKT